VTLAVTIARDAAALAPDVEAWDALAVAAERPYVAPAWILAWWRHAGPSGAELRALTVRDGEQLVGIAPFYAHGRTCSLAAAELGASVTAVAELGREREVVAAVAEALAALEPRPSRIDLPLQDEAAPWLSQLAAGWPAPMPWRTTVASTPAPLVAIEPGDDFDAWLGRKSRNFRQWVRRRHRRLEAAGGIFRYATRDTLERDVAELMRLHHARRADRGGSTLARTDATALLVDAGRELVDAGRFRLLSVELDGRTISAQLYVAAGAEVGYWNGGFDEAYSEHSPSMLGLLHAIGDTASRGERRFDLGPGDQDYKYRLADDERRLVSLALIPRGRGHMRTRSRLALRMAGRDVAKRVLSPAARARARQTLDRGVRSE
jgi:CelD/BcsL family acetyltransferase involved in cellulose biosynthesis